MKNWGFSLFDLTDSDGVLRLSFISLWLKGSAALKNGRSVFAIEVGRGILTVDAIFFKFHLNKKQMDD